MPRPSRSLRLGIRGHFMLQLSTRILFERVDKEMPKVPIKIWECTYPRSILVASYRDCCDTRSVQLEKHGKRQESPVCLFKDPSESPVNRHLAGYF